jgi:hypothetical protein
MAIDIIEWVAKLGFRIEPDFREDGLPEEDV